ncbi:MAG: protein kinase domain-containing protein [Myxococcota bacterium]
MTSPFLVDALLLGRYRLHSPLRQETRRVVWRAHDQVLGREVVLKGAYGLEPEPLTSQVVDEFRRLKRLAHPQLVPAFDLHRVRHDSSDPFTVTFFSQPWLEGPSALTLRGKLSEEALTELAITLLELVAWLHQQGLRQLDLKSEHLLRVGERWVLIDLDQARLEDPIAAAQRHGTPTYAAPELRDGSPGTVQSDLFSVGVILYEVLHGCRPCGEDSNSPPLSGRTPRDSESKPLSKLIPLLMEVRAEARPSSADAALVVLGHARRPTFGPWPTTDLLERESVLLALQAMLSATHAPSQTDPLPSRASSVVLMGSPGSGRTRLLQELGQLQQEKGGPTLHLDRTLYGTAPLSSVETLCRWLVSLGGQEPTAGSLHPADAFASEPSRAREGAILSALSRLAHIATTALPHLQAPALLLLDEPELLDELSREVLRRRVSATWPRFVRSSEMPEGP